MVEAAHRGVGEEAGATEGLGQGRGALRQGVHVVHHAGVARVDARQHRGVRGDGHVGRATQSSNSTPRPRQGVEGRRADVDARVGRVQVIGPVRIGGDEQHRGAAGSRALEGRHPQGADPLVVAVHDELEAQFRAPASELREGQGCVLPAGRLTRVGIEGQRPLALVAPPLREHDPQHGPFPG